jgi:Cof subfamily protein (haloacid dehalogenase superfamily)
VRLPALIATDLDGTLLRGDGELSDRSRAAIAAATDAGATVVAVTGRPPRWVENMHLDVGVHALCACLNGALLMDLATGEELDHAPMPAGLAAALAADIRDALPDVIFAVQMGDRFGHEPGYAVTYPRPEDLEAELADLVAGDVTKLIVRHHELAAGTLAEPVSGVVGERAEVVFSGMRIVEISAPGIHKGRGLQRVADRLGVDVRDSIAFGDALNDIPMLRAAGLGVAVANAQPDVLAAADLITASNDDDGVAAFIEALL